MGVNPGVLGVAIPKNLGRGRGVAKRLVKGRGPVVKYDYILLCTGSIFERGDF